MSFRILPLLHSVRIGRLAEQLQGAFAATYGFGRSIAPLVIVLQLSRNIPAQSIPALFGCACVEAARVVGRGHMGVRREGDQAHQNLLSFHSVQKMLICSPVTIFFTPFE